jgi:uncharacterized membrane protein (DUF106 family)
MSDTGIPEEIRKQPTSEVVDDMMQRTQEALESSARAAAELNELRRRTDQAMDWRKQLQRHTWLPMALAMGASVALFVLFHRKR